jgi:hypothetical protein
MKNLLLISTVVLLISMAAFAQTTAFTFQGRLNDGTGAATGNVQLEIRLFDSLTGGTQIGSTVNLPSVPLVNGVFSTELDFGATAFDGSPRFLEIGVRPAGTANPYTILNPRQHLSSVPYATQARNAAQLGGIDANQYVATATVGSAFVRNGTAAQTANFNIDGNGIVGGNVGIGTTNPQAKLDVSGSAQITTGGSGGQIIFAAPNGESGILIRGTSRADIRFDGSTLKLLAGTSTGAPISTNGIAIDTSGRVGIGTTNPSARLDLVGNASISSTLGVSGQGFFYNGLNVVGGGLAVHGETDLNDSIVGTVARFTNLSLFPVAGGDQSLCRNSTTGFVAFCSSSLRYKSDIETFDGGFEIINLLRPISFAWKQTGVRDIGFGAEDVAKIDPLFVNYNDKGEVEGVKYDRLSVVFVNAIREQQAQIERQQTRLERQQTQIEDLKKLVCLDRPHAAICQERSGVEQ